MNPRSGPGPIRRSQLPARVLAARGLAAVVLAVVLTACGSAGGNGGGSGGGIPDPTDFAGATSQTCAGVTGVPALYWDYMAGAIRFDYPETYRFVPYVGTPFTHPQQPLYSFMVPPGWNAVLLADAGLQLTGANVVRGDGNAVWRRLNFTLGGIVGVNAIVAEELNTMAANLGATGPFEVRCSGNATDPGTGIESAGRLVEVGGFTANLTVQAFPSNLLGGNTTVFVQLVVAPTTEYDAAAVGVFFPLTGQLTPGGGSSPECSDGVDNDGDGLVDFPDDPSCSSPDDDSEGG
jgi:hypothetical protein